MSESSHILKGDPPVEIRLRRHARARRFTLRVSRSDGRVSLSLPLNADTAEAIAFLETRADWIRGHLETAALPRLCQPGETIPIQGTLRRIVPANVRRVELDATTLLVPATAPQTTGPRVRSFLKLMARDQLATACTRHAQMIGRSYGRMTLRDTKSRWGSCNSKGDLMFSLRLAMAPPAVLDYVAAHEVAHLVEMNHSQRFWALCGKLCPDWATHRDWLSQNGPDLLSWRFDGLPMQPSL